MNCYSFLNLYETYEDNFLYSIVLFVINVTFVMARRMLHYWLCPVDLRKTGSNKAMKHDPKFLCECPQRVNKYYKEVHDSLNFRDF